MGENDGRDSMSHKRNWNELCHELRNLLAIRNPIVVVCAASAANYADLGTRGTFLLRYSLFGCAAAAAAQKAEVYSDRAGAIRGYDPVSYFTEGRPVKGSDQFTHRWKGATWRFSSAENRERFAAAPEEFAPQYGGYCAWAVANNYTASIDPQAWSIVDGKLYLNYSPRVRETWEKDIPGYIRKADANWPAVLR
jgi:YHS domain-containing protein